MDGLGAGEQQFNHQARAFGAYNPAASQHVIHSRTAIGTDSWEPQARSHLVVQRGKLLAKEWQLRCKRRQPLRRLHFAFEGVGNDDGRVELARQ